MVISAVNAGHGIEDTIAKAENFVLGARAMLAALHRQPATRLISVGGGGSLEVAPGLQLVDTGTEFTQIRPSSGRIDPGVRTGRYRVGGDQMLPGETENPRYLQRRFTVAAA
ncbi:hypothetical protein AB0H76_37875 [Nocardia sp. NPDC050712]|uniref:hypothetical protein n=1 Tax=Nocardia sp. NPDC050712 TaxID=3155518 RepID=UPI0033CC8C6A